MESDAIVRQATRADVPVLVDLIQEFYEESSHHIDSELGASAFSELIDNPRYGAVWILDSEGAVAGYVVLTVCFSMENAGLTGFVDDLFVRPRFRRLGLGKQALAAVFEESRRLGLKSLQVVVGSSNDEAVRLYKSMGFDYPDDGRQTLMATIGVNSGV